MEYQAQFLAFVYHVRYKSLFQVMKSPIFLDKYWHEKDLSHDTYFAKNIIVYYSGIMDRFNFINFMDSYNFNVNLWDITFIGKIKFFSKI